eukprot:TRINITY_DN7401_c3_g1_i2.p1 TRINITY_DN7401_c3_g1~~TRINITY_DN7401_c3_g1_i2.p1  ORF type:complete len:157 (+),score=35.42 TRINITY_DN7401_c3_g1_i2:32-502(+)
MAKWVLPEQVKTPPEGEPVPVHTRGAVDFLVFECDHCKNDLRANSKRFRCGRCDDYDLCNSCYKKDVHPKHFMWYMGVVTSKRRMDLAMEGKNSPKKSKRVEKPASPKTEKLSPKKELPSPKKQSPKKQSPKKQSPLKSPQMSPRRILSPTKEISG